MLVRRRQPTKESWPARAGAADAIMPGERQMISRILRFTHAEARKAMVPLVRVEAVPEETTVAGVIEVVRREGLHAHPGVPEPRLQYRRRGACVRFARSAGLEPRR